MYNDITGIILAGGKSKRMGVNKALLKIGGKTIIEKTAELMSILFNRVLIITNSFVEYQFLGLEMFEDIHKNIGPLAGIHSGLVHSDTEKNFIISCDVPLMIKEMIEYIIEYKSNKPIKFCEAAGYHQPLVGVYKKEIPVKIENFLSDNDETTDKSFHHFLKKVNAEIIDPQNLLFYKDELFFNVNSPDDYSLILSKYN